MSNYTKSTNFASKDSLSSGNPLKIVKGTEIDTEFNNIATAVATKADLNSPTFIGTPVAPTASSGTNTTQLATTAFVTTADNLKVDKTVTITAGTGLSGGGDLSANRSIAIANTSVTAGSYGSSAAIPVITVNAQGQLTSASTASLSLAEIGVAQTWQNLTASRSLGTTYTNSTGKPIQVVVSARCSGASPAYAYVNGVEVGRLFAPDCCGVPQYPTAPFSFIVPNGNTYKVEGYGLSTWSELR